MHPRGEVALSSPPPIRVLIADDSAVAREELTAVLERDPAVEVVAEAVNGEHAVALARVFRPTVVLMSTEMPGIDGFEATRRIMTQSPTRVIVVSSSSEQHPAHVAARAVRAGALTVVGKPSAALDPAEYIEQADRLVNLVKALADVKVVRQCAATGRTSLWRQLPAGDPLSWRGLEAVGVAASTGGPAAIYHLLQSLPTSLNIPVLIVQHIALGFIDGLASWLAGATRLPVQVPEDGDPLRGGHIYLAPDGCHLTVGDGIVRLSAAPPVGGFRPAADALFGSLADVCGGRGAGVVLSGMGHDGVDGARRLRDAGGLVLVQDGSSLIRGMPAAVAAAGLADFVGPVEELAAQIVRSAVRPVVRPAVA